MQKEQPFCIAPKYNLKKQHVLITVVEIVTFSYRGTEAAVRHPGVFVACRLRRLLSTNSCNSTCRKLGRNASMQKPSRRSLGENMGFLSIPARMLSLGSPDCLGCWYHEILLQGLHDDAVVNFPYSTR